MDRTKLFWHGVYAASFLAGVSLGWPEHEARAQDEAPPGLTAGCGRSAPEAPPARVEVRGRQREMIVAVPEGYRPDEPHDLVVAFHGRTSPAERVRRYYGLERHADVAIFVYPVALTAKDGRFSWQDPGDPPGSLRDYELFDRVLAEIGDRYCVDRARVFVVGHSLGASFANSLACARGDRIRGAATVGGGITRSACEGEVAALVMHNPKDDLVPISEGERARESYLAQNGHRGTEPEPVEVAGFGCRRWGEDAPVVWCPHDEDHDSRGRFYPHTWPEAAGGAIIDFFEALDAEGVAARE
jgi:polyhydroxybutyrate depolymerase